MRNLYILKFEESIEPGTWFSSEADKLSLQEIHNFIKLVNTTDPDDGFKINLISYSNENTPIENIEGINFMNVKHFKEMKFRSDDLVIFWSGYNHSNRPSSAHASLHWYLAMISLEHKVPEIHVLCTDTRCLMMQPEFFKLNPLSVYAEKFNKHWDKLKNIKTWPITYLTQAQDTKAFYELVQNTPMAHKNIVVKHLPLHLIPTVSHKIPEINTNHNKEYIYYGNSVTDFRDDNYRTKNLVKFFAGTNQYGGVPKLILNNISGFIPEGMEDIQFSGRVPYSEIKTVLNNSMISVILSEEDYQKCSLIPNRLVEGIAAKTFVAVHSELLNSRNSDLVWKLKLSKYQIFTTPEDLELIIYKCLVESDFREKIIQQNQYLFNHVFKPSLLTEAISNIGKPKIQPCNC